MILHAAGGPCLHGAARRPALRWCLPVLLLGSCAQADPAPAPQDAAGDEARALREAAAMLDERAEEIPPAGGPEAAGEEQER